jgi:hypothetical protein
MYVRGYSQSSENGRVVTIDGYTTYFIIRNSEGYVMDTLHIIRNSKGYVMDTLHIIRNSEG